MNICLDWCLELLFLNTHNLSKTLQLSSLTAAEGQKLADLTCQTLEKIRNGECFDLFWERILLLQKELAVNDPVLPRIRKAPRRFDTGGASYFLESPKELYRKEYYSVLNLVVNYTKDRFHQPGYDIYKNLQEILLKAATGKDYAGELQFVAHFYKDKINSSVLEVQLELFTAYFRSFRNKSSLTILQMRDYFCQLSSAARASMSEVALVLKLLMVVPATNAVSERSASALHRVKLTFAQPALKDVLTI